MPRLSPTGQYWCSGIAGAGFYLGEVVEGQPILRHAFPAAAAGPGIGHGWYDAHRAITQRFDPPGARAVLIDARTGASEDLTAHGASDVAAGGGRWAVFFSNGVTLSNGDNFPLSSMGPMGPDGALPLKLLYHSHGPWDVLEADGTRWQLTEGDADPQDICLLGGRRAVWREGWTRRAVGVPVPQPLTTPAYRLTYLEAPDGRWLQLYQADGGRLLLHYHGSTEGWVVDAGPEIHRPHGVLLPDGRVRIIWALSEGEIPSDVRITEVDLASAQVPLAAPPATVHVTPRTVPVWTAPYWSHGRHGDTPIDQHAGNAIWVGGEGERDPDALLRRIAEARQHGYPLIVFAEPEAGARGERIDPAHLPSILAWYVHGSDFADLSAKVKAVLQWPEQPIVAYLDRRGWPEQRPDWWPDRAWPNLQAYRDVGESLAPFRAAIDADLARVSRWGVWYGLTPGFYDRLVPAHVAAMLECMPLYDTWMQAHPRCHVFLPFADRRGGGMQQYPEFMSWAREFARVYTRRPAWTQGWREDEEVPVPEQDLYVGIIGHGSSVSRRDPKGLEIQLDLDKRAPVTQLEVQFENGEPPVVVQFPASRGSDGRYLSGLRVRPTVTGAYHFRVRITNANGETGEARSATPVTVTEDHVDGAPPPPPGDLLLPEDVWGIVQEEFAKIAGEDRWRSTCEVEGDPRCELGPFLNRVVWRANGNRADGPWTLNKKEIGYYVAALPGMVDPDGEPVKGLASDILQRGNLIWDVVSSDWRAVRPEAHDISVEWPDDYRRQRPPVRAVQP